MKRNAHARLAAMSVAFALATSADAALADSQALDGPFFIELHDAPLQDALRQVALLTGLDVVASSDLGRQRIDASITTTLAAPALELLAQIAGVSVRTLPSGIHVVAPACTFATAVPAPPAAPATMHRTLSLDFGRIRPADIADILAGVTGVPAATSTPASALAIHVHEVQARDVVEALVLAESLQPASSTAGPLQIVRRPDAGCGAAKSVTLALPAWDRARYDAREGVPPERLQMVGYVQQRDGAPVAILRLPDDELENARAGTVLGPASALVAGVFGDGLRLAGGTDKPALPFAARRAQEAPSLQALRDGAAHGDRVAVRRTGANLASGNGGPQDAAAAADWMRRAAELGDALAEYELASDLLDGRGLVRDRTQGLTWLRKAADGGVPAAAARLGRWLMDGDATLARDEEQGRHWLESASGGGDIGAQRALGQYYARWPSNAAFDARARRSYAAAAMQGDGVAQAALGFLNLPHDARRDDPRWPIAVRWLERAAANGQRGVTFYLGVLHDSGDDADDASLHEAAWWFEQAASRGNAQAQWRLGRITKLDPAVALSWITRAARQGVPEARTELGRMFASGDGVKADAVQAASWLRLAAESAPGIDEPGTEHVRLDAAPARGVAWAQTLLGKLLLSPGASPNQRIEGYRWLLVAAAQGDATSQAGVASDVAALTPEERAQARRDAEAWLATHPAKSAS